MKVRRAVTILLALVLIVCLGVVGWKQLDYMRGAADYSEASQVAAVPRLETVPLPEQGEKAPPDPNFDLLTDVDLESLREVNEDVRGWICIPDTALSYPVVQCGDNQYYLNHTWKGKRSSAGAIFLEWQASGDFSDFATLIYGHRMNNETMFGTLREYKEEELWREHPSIYLVHDGGVCRYDIYAAFEAGIKTQVYRLTFPERADREEFIAFGLENSALQTGVQPSPDSKIITLSTCTGRGHATRWVVQAVLTEERQSG